MDKLNRLQALTGEEDVCGEESAFQPFMFPAPKPQHLYEGTDSDSDEIIMSRGRITLGNSRGDFKPSEIQSGQSLESGDLPVVDTDWIKDKALLLGSFRDLTFRSETWQAMVRAFAHFSQ